MSSINPSRLHQQQNEPESPPPPDDFLEQMLVTLPCWPEPSHLPQSSWDLNPPNPNDDSLLLASRLQQHYLNDGDPPKPLLSQNGAHSVSGACNGFSGSVAQSAQIVNHPFNQSQIYVAGITGMNQAQEAVNGVAPPPARPKVRARRGQATDPHSIAERLRRERIAERMKGLQELVPNANKTDKASMLDEIIEYVKFLQLQVKVLSMSRLGGAAAVAPLLADISTEEGAESIQTSENGARNSSGTQAASTSDSLVVTENQVVKLMEEDMGAAMQYLQGKGLCLMPIALANAINGTSSQARNLNSNTFFGSSLDGPTSPNLSVLSAQSTMSNGMGETSIRDVNSASKP